MLLVVISCAEDLGNEFLAAQLKRKLARIGSFHKAKRDIRKLRIAIVGMSLLRAEGKLMPCAGFSTHTVASCHMWLSAKASVSLHAMTQSTKRTSKEEEECARFHDFSRS